jgi:membrane associated rhomboid family serine protease
MDEQEAYEQAEEKVKRNARPRGGFLQVLIPRKDYFITPIIVDLNILVFLAMVISGVSILSPTVNDITNWGADIRTKVMNGEPWRLLTCMFVHIGIIHLAVNMLSLISLGRLLESFIGKWRFLILYILTGLISSITSMWWHLAIAAGASGAIFGLFGIFVAIVTTKIIEPTVRKKMLRSIVFTILLNAAIGLWAGIDNAAHVGGLISGMIGGYLIFFDLKAFYFKRKKQVTGILAAIAVLCVIGGFFWMKTPSEIPAGADVIGMDNDEILEKYNPVHEKALNFWDQMNSATTADAVEKNYIIPLQNYLGALEMMDTTGLKKESQQQIFKTYEYLNWRIQAGEYYKRSITEKRSDLKDSAQVMMQKADETIININEMLGK